MADSINVAPVAHPDTVPAALRLTFHAWAAISLQLVEELEKSGLVVNGAPKDSVSHALAGATVEMTHAGMVYAWVMGNSMSIGDPMAEAGQRFEAETSASTEVSTSAPPEVST